jgi:TetR/AcrR family transcriptional regulator, transcriptional repressor for nem operon
LGVSREQATENRRTIVAAAAKLFRERGVDGVGVAELMKAAGFTQGGFYNHFKSKEALVAEVIATEMSKGATKMVRMLHRAAPKAEARLEKEINHYLSRGHRSDIESGCPVAGFSGDTPRLSVEARSQFALGLDDLISILAGLIAEAPSNPGKPDRRTLREQAISLCSQMVGALVLSRAVAEPAPALADEVLESSRRNLLAHFGKSQPQSPRP